VSTSGCWLSQLRPQRLQHHSRFADVHDSCFSSEGLQLYEHATAWFRQHHSCFPLDQPISQFDNPAAQSNGAEVPKSGQEDKFLSWPQHHASFIGVQPDSQSDIPKLQS
jgi:hypothetical protein